MAIEKNKETPSKFVCRMHLSKYVGSDPEVIIPNGVEIIDAQVFRNNDSIKTVMFPASVKSVDWSAFKECKNLETADLSQCENIWRFGDNLFLGCERLTQIVLPKRLKYHTTIPLQCFADCSSLQSVSLPVGIIKIDRDAFFNCSSLRHVELPNGINEIDQCVFHGCTSLQYIGLPDSVTFIGACTFQNCTSLTAVKLPSGIKAICSHLFEGCTSLTEIAIPLGVENIVFEAFKDCTSLSEVKIPNSVTDICENAFRGCKTLSHIYIPDSVEEIGKKAFAGCAKGFVLQSSNPRWKAYALKERLKFELVDDPRLPIRQDQKGMSSKE